MGIVIIMGLFAGLGIREAFTANSGLSQPISPWIHSSVPSG
jgi:hypothetical protein